jgi:hypothetical protein
MDDSLKTGYEIIAMGTRRAALFADGTMIPMIMGASEGDPDPDPNGGGDGGKSDDDNKFTPGQQKVIDDLINKKYGDAMTKAEAKSKAKMDALEATIAELKADKGKPQGDTQNADLTALTEGLASVKEELAQAQKKASRASLKAIASELNAVSGDQVATLISPFIKYDGDKTSILNANGEVKFNGEGKEMTIKEFVKEFLNENPHLVKASRNSGAGSASAKGKGGGASVEDLRKLPPAERITAIRAQAKK